MYAGLAFFLFRFDKFIQRPYRTWTTNMDIFTFPHKWAIIYDIYQLRSVEQNASQCMVILVIVVNGIFIQFDTVLEIYVSYERHIISSNLKSQWAESVKCRPT